MRRTVWVLVVAAVAGLAPAGAHAQDEPLQDEQWAMSSRTVANLPAAWRSSQGAGVVVAVVDTGANLQHADLAPNVWTNFGEVPGNHVDDDANGYVDDVHGIDLTAGRLDNDPTDRHGHGTHVAGIIGAAANRRGIVGVAFRAKLMIVKAVDDSGRARTSAIAEGVRYAAANGARIVNLSLGGPRSDPDLVAAIAEAERANVLVVAAAGNDGTNNDARPVYPAAIAAPNLIAVAATAPTEGRRLASVSNFGRHTVALAAPGEEVVSASSTGRYEVRTGTSMAAPHVAGVAALMASVRRDLTAAELRALILQTAARTSLPVSAGYLDAEAAVRSVATASSYRAGQRPRLRVLEAEASRRELTVRVAVSGATGAIARYRVRLGRRTLAQTRRVASPLAVRIRVRGAARRRLRVEALDRRGRRLAAAATRVRRVPRVKPDTTRGPAVGTQG